MNNKKEEKKSINDMIIEEAVKQFKEGKIQNSLYVESYLDSLLQPLIKAFRCRIRQSFRIFEV